MANRRRIRRKKRIFIGCEGSSERGYVALLQRIADEQCRAVHLDARKLTGAGDPLALVQRALAEISFGEQQPKRKYARRFLMFDTDRFGQNSGRDEMIHRLVVRARLILVRQEVCFESLLLRHFAGHEYDQPPTSSDALKRLKKIWPEYRKGMPALDLVRRIGLANVQRAADSPFNSDLRKLLVAIELISDRSIGGR